MYDATPYLADHPGGAESILITAGMDATDEFNSIHSSKAKAMLAQYYIGELVASKPVEAAPATANGNGHAAPAPAAVQVSRPQGRTRSRLPPSVHFGFRTRNQSYFVLSLW